MEQHDPNQVVTRVEALALILRCLFDESEIVGGTMPFTDVDPNAWYAKYVKFAYLKGFMKGYTDANGNPTGEFGPGNGMTRAETTAVMSRANGW